MPAANAPSAGGMGDELSEVEGHIDACIRPTERHAVDEGKEWKVEFGAVPPRAELIGRYRDRREGRGWLRLEEAESLCEFRPGKAAQGHVVGEHDELYVGARRLGRDAHRHIIRHDRNLGLEVETKAFIAWQHDRIARSED